MPEPETHSIVIIGAKLDCLKQHAEEFLAKIEEVRTTATNADNALVPELDRETSDAIHDELETTQTELSNMCQVAEITEMTETLDNLKTDLEATIP